MPELDRPPTANTSTPDAAFQFVEFNWPLFVSKRLAQGEKPDLYTVGVWKGTEIQSICLLQPLDTVMDALIGVLRARLESAGAPGDHASAKTKLGNPVHDQLPKNGRSTSRNGSDVHS